MLVLLDPVTMTYIHPLVPGCETELLSRPSALDIPSGLLTSKMKPKYSTCSFFHAHFNFIPAHALKALEILSPRIQTSEGSHHTKLQMSDGKLSFRDRAVVTSVGTTTTTVRLRRHRTCSSEPGEMGHEYRDIGTMDVDDPMEVTTSPLPSIFSSLTTLCANYHHLGTTPSAAAETVPDNNNPILEAMGTMSIETPQQNPAKHNATKAAMQTSTALSNDSNFILPRIARHLHEHHKRWMARPIARQEAYPASHDLDAASML